MLSDEKLIRAALTGAGFGDMTDAAVAELLAEIKAGDQEMIAEVAGLRAVAEAAVKDERENRNRPMALREFAELVQKLVIIGPFTSEQGRQLMMLQEMASTTLEAAVKDAVGGDEPVAWEFQHEDTGLTMYECPQQVEWGFEKNNPRWKKIGPVYRRPQASAAVPEDKWKPLLEAVMREMPSREYRGNAPGHAHKVPGIWDSDNVPEVAGKPCAWCLAFSTARQQLAASQPEVKP